MELRGPILCASDLSEAADAAIRQGFSIAREIGASLSVCHVLPEAFNVRVLFPQDAGVDTSFQDELRRKAEVAVRTRLTALLGDTAQSISLTIEAGSAHAGILIAAERLGAGLIVVGPGATALHVSRAATIPVLIARPSPTGGGVLGATDFSDPALPAVHMAAAEAHRRGVRFRLVHCLDIDEVAFAESAALPGAVPAWPFPPAIIEQLEALARSRLADALTKINVISEPMLVRRRPAVGILEAAESAATSLIVVGTRGRTGLARLILGSVAEAVIKGASCSVLAVPLRPA